VVTTLQQQLHTYMYMQ